jgi:hypothetical protein
VCCTRQKYYNLKTLKLTSPWRGIIKSYPARESFVSDITAGDGTGKKIDNLFYSVVCKQALNSYFMLYNLNRTDVQYLLILSYNMEKENYFYIEISAPCRI